MSMKSPAKIGHLLFTGAIALVELIFWLGGAMRAAVSAARGLGHVHATLAAGVVACPAGNTLPIHESERYRCGLCGFVYEGSRWICGNSRCQAVTPYVTCSCGLSIENPFRRSL
jgi:hypothetical protein